MVVNTYGIASAPAIFPRYLEQLLKSTKFVTAPTTNEHSHNLEQVQQITQNNGVQSKMPKSYLFRQEIEYLHRRLSAEGVSPDEAGVADVKKLNHLQI